MDAVVSLHFWSLIVPSAERQQYLGFLSEDETNRMARFVYDRHRDAYLNARGRMREILAQEMGIAPYALVFVYGDQGKPFLPDGPAFNLSHAGGVACLAIHPTLTLGVDIEAHRHIENGLAARFFSTSEKTAMEALPDTEKEAGFFRCWTRKEAIIKALGGGLSIPLDAFDVTLAADQPPTLTRLEPTYGIASDWAMAHIAMGSNMVGAVAAQTGGGPIILKVASRPDYLQVAV